MSRPGNCSQRNVRGVANVVILMVYVTSGDNGVPGLTVK
ncbi:hypothetical protein ARZXY2_3521 [Arthrobacter sp. ZXY-2]|nr:hypothetical protein ARZXY2_3521 [Arthrobacter sp. ZXY-2]